MPPRKLNANLCQSSVHKGSFKESTGIQMEGPAAILVCCNSLSLGQVELEGLTGHIEFNSKGQRSNYALKILQFTRNGFRQVSLACWQTPPPCSCLCPPAHFSLALRMTSCCHPQSIRRCPVQGFSSSCTRISQCG